MDPSSLMSATPGANASAGAGEISAGGMLGGVGSLLKGIAGYKASRYQAQVAKINAALARQKEDFAIIKGEQDAQRYGLQASQRMGSIRSAQGASGIDVNTGSAQDVQKSQRMVTSLDFQQIRENAGRQAYAYDAEKVGYMAQAHLDNMQATQSLIAGGIGAADSIIGSSSSVANKWLYGQQAGLTPGGSQPGSSNIISGNEGVDVLGS